MLPLLRVFNIVSLFINLGILYYSVALVRLFRGGRVAKPLLYISIGCITLVISNFLALIGSLANSDEVRMSGIFLMMVSGFIVLTGLAQCYRMWK